MKRITLDTLKQSVLLPNTQFKATVKWVARENGYAILRLTTDIGIACVLYISKDLHGSIFDFVFQSKRLELIVENVTMVEGEISQIVLAFV